MTVSTTSTRISYAGTGTTGPFDIPFKIFADGDVVVTKTVDATGVATTLTLTTDYSISGAGAAGADLTTVANVASGETLLIYLDLDISQGTDFVNNDGWDADVAENAWDRNTLICRQINDSATSYALTAPATDATPPANIPNITDRASSFLGFDASGDPIAASGITTVPTGTTTNLTVGYTTDVEAIATVGAGGTLTPDLTLEGVKTVTATSNFTLTHPDDGAAGDVNGQCEIILTSTNGGTVTLDTGVKQTSGSTVELTAGSVYRLSMVKYGTATSIVTLVVAT